MAYSELEEELIFPETETFVVAIQDQVINTRKLNKHSTLNFANRIINMIHS